MVQQGFEILRTWRTLKVIAITLIIYIPDAFSLWCLVKAVGLTLGFSDILVLLGAASLSTHAAAIRPGLSRHVAIPLRARGRIR